MAAILSRPQCVNIETSALPGYPLATPVVQTPDYFGITMSILRRLYSSQVYTTAPDFLALCVTRPLATMHDSRCRGVT